MKHMAWGAVAVLGVASLAGCYSYASDAINNHNYNTVQATPNFSVVDVGDSDQVLVRLVNDNNNGAITSYNLGNVGTGIAVHYQAGYRPVYSAATDSLVPTTDKDQQEYYVVGLALGRYSFTLTPTSVNTGVTGTVNVLVEPKNLTAALNKHTALPGDTVTITAPAGLVFSDSSQVTFATGTPVLITSIAPDTSSITFVVGGGITGPATVTRVGQPIATGVAPVTLVTTDSLVTTPIAAPIPVTVTPATTVALGQPITVTLGAGLRFLRYSVISVGQIPGKITSITADSTTATVVPGPGSNDSINFTNIALIAYHPVPLKRTTADTFSLGVVSGKGDKVINNTGVTGATFLVPTTLSATSGDAGSSQSVTIGGGLVRFTKTSTVVINGAAQVITSFSADSLTANIIIQPPAALAAPVTFTNLAIIAFPTSPLISAPSDHKTFTISLPDATLQGGGGDISGSGFVTCTATITKALGAPANSLCHYFQVTLPLGAPASSITWTGVDTDLGLELFSKDATTCVAILADDNGVTPGVTGDEQDSPLDCSGDPTTIPAGNYVLVVIDFSNTAIPTSVHAHIGN